MKNPLSKLFKKPKLPLCYAFEFKQETEHHPFDLLVKKYPSQNQLDKLFVQKLWGLKGHEVVGYLSYHFGLFQKENEGTNFFLDHTEELVSLWLLELEDYKSLIVSIPTFRLLNPKVKKQRQFNLEKTLDWIQSQQEISSIETDESISAENFEKLIFNVEQKGTIADLFRQLKEIHLIKGQPILDNSTQSLCRFLKFHTNLFEDTSLKSIENYFVKENYRPQRGKHKLSVKVGHED